MHYPSKMKKISYQFNQWFGIGILSDMFLFLQRLAPYTKLAAEECAVDYWLWIQQLMMMTGTLSKCVGCVGCAPDPIPCDTAYLEVFY